MKILMIDDNDELLKSVTRIFKEITAEACYSATEAIAAIMAHSPDVVLLDHQLSDKGDEGFEVVRWIKDKGLKIKIYTTTKNDDARQKYEAMSIGWIDKNDLAGLKGFVAEHNK